MKFKIPRLFFLPILTLSLLTCFSSEAAAQVLYGSVVGTVTDQSNGVVEGATVTITNTATGATREATSDEAGRYTILNLLPGDYRLEVSMVGFTPFTRTNLAVVTNTVSRVDARLAVGGTAEEVTVAAGVGPIMTTDKADVHTNLSSQATTNLPLPNYRNYQSLINLVPGATPTAFQNAVVDTPARSLTTNINGTARNNNNTRVDGAANVFIWLPHHTLYNPPAEAIETVNISTSSFDAEQGMTGGAAITVTTKSGTNDFNGVAYWYHNNQRLNSRPFFFYPQDNRLPVSIDNMGGFTVGGPIVENKLFYFGSYERTMQRLAVTGRFSVPPADVRAGDFSRYTDLSLIYDPMTGNPDGSGRTPFPNNIVPAGRISPIFAGIQNLAPLPNIESDDIFGLTGNYQASGTQRLDRDQYDIKINWVASDQLSLWGKYSRMDALVTGPAALGEIGGPALGTRGTGDTKVNIPTVGFSYVFSPTFLMDGNFSYTRFDQDVFGPDHGRNWGLDWGIPGTNGGTQFSDDDRYSGQPAIAHGFTAWGNTDTWMPLFRNDRSYLYNTNFSKVMRSHEVRFGYDVIRHEMNHWQPETANPRGSINFSGNTTMIQGGTAHSINQYAAALLGNVNNYSKSVQFFLMETREWQHALYVRDRWQATRNLTLNFGVRYEYYPLIHRGDRGIERWDPATNLVTIGGLGNVPRENGMSVAKNLFAPRLGLSYRLGDSTVVRTGYGLTYDPLPFSRPLRGLYPSTITASWVPLEQYGFFNDLNEGIPDVPLPDVTTGVVELPPTVDMGPRSPWGGELRRGYIQSWNLTVQQRMPWEVVGSVAYVGTQTTHQLGDRDINAAPIGTGVEGRPLFETLGRRITTNMWDGFASGNYHGLQATIDRRFVDGLFLRGAYTWSKTINMFDDTGWVGLPLTNLPEQLHRNRAPAGYDRRHMFTMAWIYELPVGTGQRLNLDGIANQILGGWKVNGMVSAYSGTPFTVVASGASLNAPGSTQTADLITTPRTVGDKGPGTMYYDVTAFADPGFNRAPDEFRFGTMGRNALYGPGFSRLDLSLFKGFRITERSDLEFRVESFNLTNTPRFNNPGANVSVMTFNPDGTVANPNNFLAITSAAANERQFRFGLRLTF
jgi:hypothetical protein